MRLTFRDARPDDAAKTAELIYSAGPETIAYAFATSRHRPIDFIRTTFANGSGVIGYKNHRVALVDGRIAGIGAFYNADRFDRLSREMVWQVFRFYGIFKSWGVLKRAGRLATIMPPPPQNVLFVQNVAVDAGMRGRGVCTALFEERIGAARSEGTRLCVLDVAADNTRARKLYEKLGFQAAEKRNWPYSDGSGVVPDHVRMVLPLQGNAEYRDRLLVNGGMVG